MKKLILILAACVDALLARVPAHTTDANGIITLTAPTPEPEP